MTVTFMTVAEAIEYWNRRMQEYSERIQADPSKTAQWIDQAYGYTMGMQAAVEGMYEAMEIYENGEYRDNMWNQWYMQNHPAYKT